MSTHQDDAARGTSGLAADDGSPGAPGMGGIPAADPDADRLRRALRDAATGIRPSPWPARAVMERAGRGRRNRRLTVTLSAVAVVAAAGSGIVLTENRAGGSGGPQAAPAAAPAAPGHGTPTASHVPTSPPTPALTWPTVRVVAPGRVVVMGHGPRLKLEAGQRCVGTPGDWSCKSVTDGNQAAGTVSLQSQGGTTGALYTPLYIGGGTAARMSVTVAGHEYPLQVVTLPGHPGYATGYGTAPAPARGPGERLPAFTELKVTVYDTSGTVLATLP
ncbi:hypothetical protein [Actinacidiphila acidipaludis]|uniref:Uncharacterized protein n=1 Tax=Actinacidiphila acidipaludis TaxID=2873382 RepID=A0ABS7QF28_9ACTN|nr:hypothetical protein [Streptomyces acidipaludis]MBY8881767.1 hypothetical protein [Streptomyces acidipaludis]